MRCSLSDRAQAPISTKNCRKDLSAFAPLLFRLTCARLLVGVEGIPAGTGTVVRTRSIRTVVLTAAIVGSTLVLICIWENEIINKQAPEKKMKSGCFARCFRIQTGLNSALHVKKCCP